MTATTRRAGAGAEEVARREHEGIAATRPRAMAERILFRRVRAPRGGGGEIGALKERGREQRVKESKEPERAESVEKKKKKEKRKNKRPLVDDTRLTVFLLSLFPSPSRTLSSGETQNNNTKPNKDEEAPALPAPRGGAPRPRRLCDAGLRGGGGGAAVVGGVSFVSQAPPIRFRRRCR